jgi:hypothetical protein
MSAKRQRKKRSSIFGDMLADFAAEAKPTQAQEPANAADAASSSDAPGAGKLPAVVGEPTAVSTQPIDKRISLFLKLSLAACLICGGLSVVLRMNAPDLGILSLFLTLLSYLLVGTTLYLCILRIRLLKKRGKDPFAPEKSSKDT